MPEGAHRGRSIGHDQEAFADALTYIPCTCGCASMGHESVWNCFVRRIEADGTVVFEEHAAFCDICQDITRDAMALWQRGSPLSEIRETIDATYEGPQTPTDPPRGCEVGDPGPGRCRDPGSPRRLRR